MVSAPAAQISSTISENWIIHVNGQERPDYARTQAAMMTVIFTLLFIWIACGTEQRGSHFELAAAAGGQDSHNDKLRNLENYEMRDPITTQKGDVEIVETQRSRE